MDADGYLQQLSRYIHRNPVEAGLVERPERSRWSSSPAYIGRAQAPAWLHLDMVLGSFGGGDSARRYQAFVRRGVDAELREFYGAPRPGPVLGGERFRSRLASEAAAKRADPEVPEARLLAQQPSLSRIAELTAEAFGVPLESLYRRRRGPGSGNLPRMTAMASSRNPGGHALADIAAAFGTRHYASVSVAASRLKQGMRKDRGLANTVAALRHELRRPNAIRVKT